MGFQWWKRKLAQSSEQKVYEKPVSLPELLQQYEEEKFFLSTMCQGSIDRLTDEDYARLRAIETRLIMHSPDRMQQQVLSILARHGFDLSEFLGPKDWQVILGGNVRAIVHFLHYGESYPGVSEPARYFLPGDALFIWLLQQARDGADVDPIANVSNALSAALKQGSLLGQPFTPNTAQDFGLRLIVTLNGEYAKHTRVLLDIFNEVEDGEALLTKMIHSVHLTPIP